MPSKNAKENTKTPKNKSFLNKVKALASGKAKPLLAVLIVLSVVGVGYYGFVRSSADTLNNSGPPTVNCGKNLTNKECNAKQAASDAQYYAQVQADCNSANRRFNGKGCGGCVQGYAEGPGGNCRKTVDCPSQNRIQKTELECGGCKATFVEKNNACQPRQKVDCAAQFRKQVDDYTCGDCKQGTKEQNKACVPVTDKLVSLQEKCDALNRTVAGNECGGCKSDFVLRNALCVATPYTQAQIARVQKQCANQQRNYEAATNSCSTCYNKYSDVSGVCMTNADAQAARDKAKKQCANQHRVYSALTNSCTGCLSTYPVEVNSKCMTAIQSQTAVRKQCSDEHRTYTIATNTCGTCLTTHPLVVANKCMTVGEGGLAIWKAQKECTDQHRVYDRTSNACGTCLSTYPALISNTCMTTAQGQLACAFQGRTFSAQAKACAGCVTGYSEVAGKCQKNLTPTEQCALRISVEQDNCNLTASQVSQACVGLHRSYIKVSNSCSETCLPTWYLENNICKKVSTVAPDTVKAGCEKDFLRYDKATNRCLAACKATYVMRDGKCVEWSEAGMTKWRCSALGRVWTPGAEATNETEATVGSCALTCINESTTVPVNTGNPDTSYCKAKKDSTSIDGVSLTMTREECLAQHRTWISSLEACSARCQTGWYINDSKCSEVKPATDDNEEGDGQAGGCEAPLQDDSIDVASNPDADANVCPTDEPGTPAADTPADQPVTHDTEVLMDRATCRLLGRVWVPDANVDGKKVKGGCSAQECRVDDAEVRRSNGSAYCEGSVDRISMEACLAAHRTWIPKVNACAAVIGNKDTKAKVDAKQCDAPYTVYVQRTKEQGGDVCLKPSAYQRMQTIAQNVGKPVADIASLPAKALCNLQKNKEWIDGQCVKSRVAAEKDDSIVKDTFGNKLDLSNYTQDYVTCSEFKSHLGEQNKAKFTCVKKDVLCEQAGGLTISAFVNKDSKGDKPDVLYSSVVCWTEGRAFNLTVQDSFNNRYNASTADVDAVSCDELRSEATGKQKKHFDCSLAKKACKAAGGDYKTFGLYLEEGNRTLHSEGCWILNAGTAPANGDEATTDSASSDDADTTKPETDTTQP